MDLAHAEQLAKELMGQHGLPWKGWTFQFDNAKRRCGQCQHDPKIISLGRSYVELNREELIRDTILHEIAHAKVGRGHGHDNAWKLMARSIGAHPVSCKDAERDGLIHPETDWYSICSKCGARLPAHRRPRFKGVEYFHRQCGRNSHLTWYYKSREYSNWGVPADYRPTIAQAAEQPKSEISTKPTQAQINELWARLDKLEGK